MSAALPSTLPARFQRYIEEGLSGRAAAMRLKVSACSTGEGCVGGIRSEQQAVQGPPYRVSQRDQVSWPHMSAFSKN